MCGGLAAKANDIRSYRRKFRKSSFRPVFYRHFMSSDIRETVPFFNEFALRGEQAYWFRPSALLAPSNDQTSINR